MLSYPETLAVQFEDWLKARETANHQWELPEDGSLATLVALWMQDTTSARATTYDAFIRAVVLLVAEAARGNLHYDLDGVSTTVTIPTGSASWWMLEPMEFEATRHRAE